MQIVDANILKQYIFQKGFITESAKLKREQEAASSTLQVFMLPLMCLPDHLATAGMNAAHHTALPRPQDQC